MSEQMPAEVFAPGEILREELDAQGWTQTEFSDITGLNPRTISEIVSAKRAITPETAVAFGQALRTGPQFWMNMETAYQISKLKVPENAISRRARLYSKFPVKDMIKRGWIQASPSLDFLEKQFLQFYQLNSIDDSPKLEHAAKKTSYSEPNTQQIAWLFRAKNIAAAAPAEKYSDTKLAAAYDELLTGLEHIDAVRWVPGVLAKAGIRLVVLEALPGSKIDGACFWFKDSPVIVISMRFDRIDNFWHTLLHELDHIKHGEGKASPIVDVDMLGEDSSKNLPQNEVRANENAASFSIPRNELDGFIARVGPMYSDEQILGFARRLKVHPGIVVGQLQNRKQITYAMHRKHLEKVRQVILGEALTDGFGHIVTSN